MIKYFEGLSELNCRIDVGLDCGTCFKGYIDWIDKKENLLIFDCLGGGGRTRRFINLSKILSFSVDFLQFSYEELVRVKNFLESIKNSEVCDEK